MTEPESQHCEWWSQLYTNGFDVLVKSWWWSGVTPRREAMAAVTAAAPSLFRGSVLHRW